MSQTSTVTLIEPADLKALIDADEEALLILQITSAELFNQAHIPGAVLVTPQQLVCGVPPATGRLPDLPQLTELFRSIGYRENQDIVVCDDEGGGWAGRMGWTLDVIGHKSWRYLNGGLHAWQADGFAFENASSADQQKLQTTDVQIQIDTSPIAEIPDVLATIDDADKIVWDVRSAEEYAGTRQASARSGHIPGAINRDWMLLKDAENFQRLPSDLAEQLQALGLTADKEIITHCQTHHRSGLSYMIGRLYGLNIKAYHGSWSEWGNREDTPIE